MHPLALQDLLQESRRVKRAVCVDLPSRSRSQLFHAELAAVRGTGLNDSFSAEMPRSHRD